MKALDSSILKLATPLILSGMTAPLLGLINILVLGHLENSTYLAAAAFGEMIFNFLYWVFNFLRMGTTGLAVQVAGQTDRKPFLNIINHSAILALVLAFIILVAQIPIMHAAFAISSPKLAIQPLVHTYFGIRVWAAPAVLLQYVMMGILISISRTRVILLITVIINAISAVLCVLFVYVLHWNIAGVASADVIGQYIGLAVGFLAFFRLNLLSIKDFKPQYAVFKKLIQVNTNLFFRTLSLIIGFSFFTIQSNHLGVVVLAANNLLLTLKLFASNVMDGFVGVTESKVGNAFASKSPKALKEALIQTFWWTLIAAIVCCALYLLFGGFFIDVLTDLQAVRHIAHEYLIYLIIGPLVGALAFYFDGVFIGLNAFKAMRNIMILSLLIYLFVWVCLKGYGNDGLWIAFLSFFVARSVLMSGWYWRLRKWN